MNRLLNIFKFGGFAAAAAGILIGVLAQRAGEERLVWLGASLLGAGVALAFIDPLVTGRVTLGDRYHDETYSGIAARLWGLLMMLIGAAIFVVSLFSFVSPDFLGNFLETGIGLAALLLMIGLSIFFYSVIRILGHEEQRESTMSLLLSMPGRFFFVLFALVGLVLLLAGVLQLISPGLPWDIVQGFLPDLPPLPAAPG